MSESLSECCNAPINDLECFMCDGTGENEHGDDCEECGGEGYIENMAECADCYASWEKC